MNIANRTTHPVQQGTGPWLRLREDFFTASEAPAALGVSKYVTRSELLRRKYTGVAEEHSAATLGKFAAGHDAEALARPLAENQVGGELFPVTMSAEVDGLRLLASLDGLTMDDEICWETKLWNEELAAHVRAGTLPEHYTVQMDQELLVSGASRCLFTCTDGTPERFVCCWYEPSPERFQALVDGWRRFQADLASYTLQPRAEKAEAEPIESLPAVAVRMDGALVVQSNLPAFGVALRAFVDRVPKRPSTDIEFATAEAACKALKRAEDALDAAEENALASLSDVEVMRRMVADFRKLARDTRLASEKMVERRKLEIKEEAVMAARRALDKHIATLNAELAPFRLPTIAADFAGCIKGLKSVASMQDKVDGLLATTKIAAEADARAIRENAATFTAEAAGFEFLFADVGQVIHKAADDFIALLRSRIATHKAAEAEKERRRQEQVAAEQARQAEAAARAQEAARVAAAAAAAAVAVAAAPAPVVAVQACRPEDRAMLATPAGAELVKATAAALADEPATLSLGAIGNRLGFALREEFIAGTLGVHPAARDKRAVLYRESQFTRICAALQAHIANVCNDLQVAA